jgi:transcriptional regulator with XRE-family HTH domain
MPRPVKAPVEVEMLGTYSRNLEHQIFLHGWSVDELMQRSGLGRNTINRIRKNRHKQIDPLALTKLSKVFNVTPNELLLRQEGIVYI